MKVTDAICLLIPVLYFASGKCPSRKFGALCRYRCHCVNDGFCDDVMGECQNGCARAWSGENCQKQNIALERPAKQRGRGTSNTADMAVDALGIQTCARTPPNATGWWRLNLEYQATISRIKLTSDVGTSLRDWAITIGNYDTFPSTPPCTIIRRHRNSAEISCDVMQSGRYITVFNRHGAVRLCNFEVYSCSMYTFGPNCSSTCRCADYQEVCNNVDGHCRSGCSPGWTGQGCDRECPGQMYGSQCLYSCGQCRNGMPCDKRTGICSDGCDLGWMNKQCNEECFPGTYGEDCRTLCGHCLQGSWCHHKTGICPDGCRNGWSGSHCNITCPPLKYGENCALDCGHCMNGTKCHDETGICNKGCDVGWKSLFCKQECLPGSYGFGCKQRCENCYDRSCDRFLGICNQGCAPGWVGRECQLNCLSGYYGDGCQERCGLCKDGGMCTVTTGECPFGCHSGWKQGYCNETCDSGFYGESCVTECGQCDGLVSCDRVTGICPAGCSEGFSGTKCDKKNVFEDVDNPKLWTTVIVVGSIVVSVLIIITVCFVLKWRRDTIPDQIDDEALKKPLDTDTRDRTEADEDDVV